MSLKERMDIPEELEAYVNDYRINLFQIAYLTQEQVQSFQSDFRIVADYFVQKREKGDYVPSTQEITHVQETLQLLSVMTNDRRFEEIYNERNCVEGGLHNMCDVLDRAVNKGEDQVALLMKKLFDANRIEDAKRASQDKEYRNKLLKELKIAN